MARIRVHTVCMRPLNECDCVPDDEEISVDVESLESGEDNAA